MLSGLGIDAWLQMSNFTSPVARFYVFTFMCVCIYIGLFIYLFVKDAYIEYTN